MSRRRSVSILTALFIFSNASAQSYSDSDLKLINAHKNLTISSFLNKQGFPPFANTDTATEFAERQDLVRDRRLYGSEVNKCKDLDFYLINAGDEYNSPEINKTITLQSNENGSTKAEYQAEWDKILKRLGKPSHIEVSRQVWPFDKAGMIDYVTYKINHNGRHVFVSFRLTTTGCLTANVSYTLDRDMNLWIINAKEKLKPKASAANSL